MPASLNLAGQRFGRLTAISPVPNYKHLHRGWECLCDCGNTVTVRVQQLRAGKTQSCGCLRRDNPPTLSHGHTRRGKVTPTYSCWQAMCARCHNPNHPNYKQFGAQGIIVCERWSVFENFLADMGEKPGGLQIERLDNAGNYEPENCRWANRSEKGFNNRASRKYTVNGITKSFGQWAEHLGIGRVSLWERLKKWPLDKALTTPPQRPKEPLPKTRYGNNWYGARRAALKRAKGKCERCKKTKTGLHIHHKIPIRYFKKPEDGNFLANLMAVCHPCHTKEHEEMATRFPLLDTIGFENSARRSRRDIRRFITWRGHTKTLTEWGRIIPDKRYPVQWLSARLRRYPLDQAMEPLAKFVDS